MVEGGQARRKLFAIPNWTEMLRRRLAAEPN
jgi:hypothetical protein